MSPGPPSLEDLVRAICEGKAIDWETLEQEGSPGFRHKLAALRVVENIARVHRAPSAGDASAQIPTGDEEASPARWGHLDLLEHLASGAFGDVYRAWDPALDREVALKLLRRPPDSDAHVDEALEEGRLLARVHHPNVVTVFGAARVDGRAGVWMELVRGSTLAEIVRGEGALPVTRVASIGLALCEALGAVHAAGLLHRDVKAQNVMVGGDGRVVLMDFGAGGSMRHAGLEHGGTPLYLAPEVAAGGPATVQSDVYSLGVLLRYALTGSYAKEARPSRRERGARRLGDVLTVATAASPHERFESAGGFSAALRPLARPPRIAPVAAFAGAALVLSIVLLTAVAFHGLWPLAGGAASNAPATGRLNIRPLWTKWPADYEVFGRPARDGRVLPMTRDYVHIVLTDINLANITPGPALGAATDGLIACEVVSPVALAPSLTEVAFSCQTGPEKFELRTVRLNPARPVQRRLAQGALLTPTEWTSDGLLVVGRQDKHGSTLGVMDLRSGVVGWLTPPGSSIGHSNLSPDGKWLAFDGSVDGNPARHGVYVVGRSGGAPATVAASQTDSILPMWTPDGRAIVFVSDRTGSPGLWMQPVEGGRPAGDPRLLAQDLGRVATVWTLTPDGAFIYFRQTGLVRIATVGLNADGTAEGKPTDLPTGQLGATMMPDWAPDGRRLAYQTRLTGAQAVTLSVLEVGSGAETHVKTALVGLRHPRWSPDGRRIVVKGEDTEDRQGVFLIDPATGHTTPLKVVPGNAEDPLGGVVWAHDGTLVSGRGDGFARIDPRTGNVEPLMRAHVVPLGFGLSPLDGTIAWIDDDSGAPVLQVGTPTRAARQVLRGEKGEVFSDVVWMPDGRTLLFIRWKHGPTSRLSDVRSAWRVDTRSGVAAPINLAVSGLRELAVTPDGRRLAFTYGLPTREPWIIEHFLPAPDGATAREIGRDHD